MKAYIAFGSNLGERLQNLSEAKRALGQCPNVKITAASPAYETEAVGCKPGARPFVNAVVAAETDLTPHQLLDVLQQIEEAMGRDKSRPQNAPRRIDLDLLLCDNLILQDERLTLPHPRLAERRFVLKPLAEINPFLVLPGIGKSVTRLLAALNDTHWVRKIADQW